MPTAASADELARRLHDLLPAQTREHAFIHLDPHGRIVGWRGAAPEIFGYAEAEVLGAPGSLIFTPEDTARGLDRHELAVAARDSRAIDDRWHVRKDGTRIWASGSVEAIRDDAGEVLGFTKVVRDRTDQRAQLEAVESELHALRERWSATLHLLRSLGHEMRNPLGPLLNTAHILDRASDDERVRRAAALVRSQVGALTRLADDLLEAARAERGHLELRTEPADLRELVRELAEGFEPLAQERRVDLQLLLPQAPLPVQVDRQRFGQVVRNLLSNALKYTPAGGHVWAKASTDGADAVLRVEDTGIGIDPQALPRIFELFTRGPQAEALEPSGLGVGLAVTQQIVRQHGGSVQARSAGTGHGAEFTVRLPLAAPRDGPAEVREAPVSPAPDRS